MLFRGIGMIVCGAAVCGFAVIKGTLALAYRAGRAAGRRRPMQRAKARKGNRKCH